MIAPVPPGPGDTALRLSRRYDATPEEVFRAFTDPAWLRQWWGPRGFTIDDLDFPAGEGARYSVRLTGPDGQVFAHEGEFLRVEPPRRLTYTWRWTEGPLDRSETLVDIVFAADRGGVVVELCHSRFVSEVERDKHTGWQHALEALAEWLPKAGPRGPASRPRAT